VAGQFYSKDPEELRTTLAGFFEKAVAFRGDPGLRAIIVPHAGYVFSGQVAASGFNQIDPEKEYKRIFIIGSSHTTHFDAASVYAEGNFITPLGKVPVDTAVANALIRSESSFQFFKDAHWYEHSLEVELPFLQFHLKHPFSIVPIIMGGNSIKTVKKVADALKPYMDDENLFVISSDFSHYPKYADAVENDRRTMLAILKNSPDALTEVIASNDAKKIPGLVTSLCGWTSVMTLLYMTENDDAMHYVHLQYQNSGDTHYGDSSRVVGYNAIAVYNSTPAKDTSFSLSVADKKSLLSLARKTIESYIKDGKTPVLKAEDYSSALSRQCGAFVSLHEDGNLRGCIGRFTADIPLYEVVRDMAIASSTQDYRFPKVSAKEIPDLEIEISVLSPMKKISSIDEIVMGTHGIYITKGGRSGTFLPQVAIETGWSKEDFLGHCAQDKAGIGWDGWKNADIYIYTAVVFSEKDLK
jgi:AmmeMemoRadiSam system protein B/AmmeMemoRadiSam system protein A